MIKFKSWDELKAYRASLENGNSKDTLLVSMGTCGIAAGANATFKALTEELASFGAEGVTVTGTGCMGLCYAEPVVELRAQGRPSVYYGHVDEALARKIVRNHVAGGQNTALREVVENAVLSGIDYNTASLDAESLGSLTEGEVSCK